MGFLGRIGDAWQILTGVVEVKVDDSITIDGKQVTIAELRIVDSTPRKFDISSISGNLEEWVRINSSPAEAKFSIDGEVVTINGTLPLKEIT